MENHNDEELQEMQVLDQNLHNVLLQKQSFELELSETKAASKEIAKSGDVYKLIGDLLIKREKSQAKEELENKEKILELRIKSVEKQQDALEKRLEELRKKLSDSNSAK
jgi:prefoldin beta subunit